MIFSDGMVRPNLSSNRHRNTKTIDFKWKHSKKVVYASHKYIKDEGGAQDNQFSDVMAFISVAAKILTKEPEYAIFVAICDGPYFQRTAGDDSRISRMRKQVSSHRGIIIGQHHEVLDILDARFR